MPASALAAHFEVSVRTIHRDIDQLSAAGIPVYAERGRSGGFALLDGYRTKLTGLTQPEAETLFLAGLPGPAAQLGLSDLLSAARLKLLAALPANLQGDAERVAERFHLDPTTWFHEAEPLPLLQPVARAVWSGQILRLRYRNKGEVYDRTLAPLGLVLKGGVWYLVARSGENIRTYRMAQIVEVTVTEETFVRPPNFDLTDHWKRSSSAYEAGILHEVAEVRLSPRGLEILGLLGRHVVEAARQSGTKDEDGWLRCRIPIESVTQGSGEVLRLGDAVEVLGPPVLRARMAEIVGSLARRYGADPSA